MADETVSRLDIARQRRQQLAQHLAPSADRLADLRDAVTAAGELFAQTQEAYSAARERRNNAFSEYKDAADAAGEIKLELERLRRHHEHALATYGAAATLAQQLGGVA